MLHVEIFYLYHLGSDPASNFLSLLFLFLPAAFCPLLFSARPPSCCSLPPFLSYKTTGHCPRAEPCATFLRRVHFVPAAPCLPCPLTPKAPFSAHALSASSLTYFSLSATAPRPLSSPRRQQRRRQWNKFVRLLRLLDPLPTGCKQQAGSQRRSPVS